MRPNNIFWPWWYKAAASEPPHFGCWLFQWYVSFKPTKDELFSERHGYRGVIRLKGWSMVYGRRHK